MFSKIITLAFILAFFFVNKVNAQLPAANNSVAIKQLQQFIEANPGSVSSLRRLKTLAYTEFYNDIIPLYHKLSTGIANSDAGKKLLDQINATKELSRGSVAPDFTLPDTAGNTVALSSLRGKYVLIDFWASWCVPCRKENPAMIKLYNKYKDKGFDIIGVSLDKAGARQAWIKAIKADRLKWLQISDLKVWDNAAATLYGIRSIPQNYLIDPAGKIIAKNLHREELDAKLNAILNGLKNEQ